MSEGPTSAVTAAQAGDDQGFARLVRLYDRPVLRVACQVLGNLQDAEDAAQEAWTIAYRRLGTLQDAARFGPWLYRIVANVALRKRQQRARMAPVLDPARGTIVGICDEPASLLEGTENPPRADLLPAAMEALSAKDRLVLSLHYYSQMTVDQIATLLGVPAGTVKSRLHHMRQTIRREIENMASTPKRQEHVPADFRQVIVGMRGEIPWQPALTDDLRGWSIMQPGPTFEPVTKATLPPHWQRAGDGLIGEDPAGGSGTCLMFGEPGWTDYEVSMLITVLAGGNGQVFFRMDTGRRKWYVLDMMMGWQTVDIHMLEVPSCESPHLTRLSVVNYPLEREREYAVSIAARGESLTTYVDGALVNQVTDRTLSRGGIGLCVWQGRTLFRDIKIRHMS
jgi:RNA polymerase sigma-70 factor, ECF subfamily